MSSDWHESEAKAECIDLRLRVRELEAQYTRECEEHRREVELSDARDTLTRELAGELKEWRIRNPDGYEAAAQLVGALRADVAELRAIIEAEFTAQSSEIVVAISGSGSMYRATVGNNLLLGRGATPQQAASQAEETIHKWFLSVTELACDNAALTAENERLQAIIDERIAADTYTAAMQLMDDLK